MRDALDEVLLSRALGIERPRLLTTQEMQGTLLDAEISLFSGSRAPIAPALASAWYLHAIAMSPQADDDSNAVRRGDAGRVAAHVFDLHLQQSRAAELPSLAQLRFVVAAQTAYHLGGLVPNAIALRAYGLDDGEFSLEDEPGRVSLTAAKLLLEFDLRRLGEFLTTYRPDAQSDSGASWAEEEESPYAAAVGVLRGIELLRSYLLSGNADVLADAREAFNDAVQNRFSAWDTDSRWVAALLSDFGAALGASSVWSVLPPGTPPSVGRALTLGDPPIYTLWPPQAEFLRSIPSPFDRASRRMVLSLPTSAGKTLIAQVLALHFLASFEQGVCVIAPTHALCREISRSFESRLGMLGTYAHDGGAVGSRDPLATSARVLVITPERFASILRSNPQGLLEHFGLFIVDEAHLLSEQQRGWQLEETLATIHHLTATTDHQLVLVSAAMGHAAHTRQWMTVDAPPIALSTQWRGPRRLHAIYGTEFADAGWQADPARGNRNARRRRQLRGRVYLSGPGESIPTGTFTQLAGEFVQRQRNDGTWTKDDSSTKEILRLLPLVEHLLADRSTNVLIVVAQRREARELATAIAGAVPLTDASAGLAERLSARLPGHSLPDLVRHGVAYHHGLLPSDVQADVERAAGTGILRCVVSTTTLTEGVNLPFKAVVIGSTGWGSGEAREVIIDTPRLLNAFGRAGRACRETEGWLFMAINEAFQARHFDEFNWDPSELDLQSTLTMESALHSLAAFEELLARGADAVLSDDGLATRGFCSYVWFLAELLNELNGQVSIDDVLAFMRDTLAWQQLDPAQIASWERVAAAGLQEYERTPQDRRRRWGRAGTSIPTSALLEEIAAELAARVSASELPGDFLSWLELLLSQAVIERLLKVSENPSQPGFKPYRSAPRTALIDVDLQALVLAWLSGVELDQIADTYLAGISDADYRADALSEFSASVLEHHLPWMLATLIAWVNERVDQPVIPAVLPAMLHYGVSTETALNLMGNGVRSRRLANAIAGALDEPDLWVLRQRLRQQTIEQWQTDFGASPAELSDLLLFVSDPDEKPVSDLLDGVPVIALVDHLANAAAPTEGDTVAVSEAGVGEDPRPLVVIRGDDVIGRIAMEDHSHVHAILQLGLALRFGVHSVGPDHFELAISIQG